MKANRSSLIFICTLLAISVLIIYGQVGKFDFIRYDEELYVTKNSHVLSGMSLDGLLWAFTTQYAGNWHPLTWLSLMLDRELYGMNAGGYHWTSVVLHLLSGLVLFFTFIRMTGHPWRSGLLAGLFLIHPLHVESVAWVAERKDVLSGLFWMLSMWGYARYAERAGAGRYLWVVLFFAMGLMSKPMVVTLPFVLLLLDYWPLGRMDRGTVIRLLYEKVPLFFLSTVSSIITFIAQKEGEAVASLQNLPFTGRMGNAVVSYAGYLVKLIWPFNLAIFYTHPGTWPAREIVLALILLLLITSLVLAKNRHCRYMLVGWLWYLGTLVPVIGLVQVGAQSMADRYTYLPLIGIFIMVVWGSAEFLQDSHCRRVIWGAVSGAVIAILLVMTQIQVGYWKNSIALFSHALHVTEKNYQAHNNLARALTNKKKYTEAVEHYRTAIRINPFYMPPYLNLGLTWMEQGKLEEALTCLTEALKIKPGDGDVLFSRGNLFSRKGLWDEAIAEYRMALKEKPYDSTFHNNLGLALTRKGRVDQAIEEYRAAIRLAPEHAGAHNNLAMLLLERGQIDDAVGHFREAIKYQPDYANAHYQLAQLLSSKGLADEAAYHLREAGRINPDIENAQKVAIPKYDARPDDRVDR
jgi:Tfp pilus assembly protein PilF